MPYVDEETRNALDCGDAPQNSGELNYMITRLLTGYLTTRGLRYSTINDIIGAVEGAKSEFYRRVAVPYEAQKIKENGDVY